MEHYREVAGPKVINHYMRNGEVEKAEAAKIAERIKVLGQEGYLKQYAIDHGLNPYQPTTGGLITDSTP